MPSLSVIVPTHNDARFLSESVGSVLAQGWPGGLEVIVVDDGSAPPASEAFRPPSQVVRMLRQENAGVSAARNAGIALAQGELVAFLDADDAMLPGRLAAQAAVLEARPDVGLVGGDITRRDLEGHEESWGLFEAFGAEVPAEPLGPTVPPDAFLLGEDFARLVLCHYPFNTSVMTARRSLLVGEGATRFDPGLTCWEDWDFAARLARRCRVGYVRRPVTLYRKRPGSITTVPDARKFVSRARMLGRWQRDFRDIGENGRRRLGRERAAALLTASWDARAAGQRALAVRCAVEALARRPTIQTLRALAGAILGAAERRPATGQ